MNNVYGRLPESSRAALGLFVACGAQFLIVIDSLIVTIALPAMRGDLGLSIVGQQWIVNGYLLTFGGLLLLAARVGDKAGHRKIFLSGLAIVVTSSLVGVFASVGWLLVATRVFQGIGAACLAPSSLSLIMLSHTEPEQRTRALSIWSATSGSAGAIGLVLGGILTQAFGWRSVMLVNVLAAALLLVVGSVVLRHDGPHPGRLDVIGGVTITLCAGSLVYAMSSVGHLGWSSPAVWVLLIITALFAAAHFKAESRVRDPLIPPGFLRRKHIAASHVLMAVFAANTTGTTFFLSLYQQQILGYGALATGLALMPMSVTIAAGALVSKRLLSGLGARTLLVAGSLVSASALFWMSHLPLQSRYVTHVLAPSMVWAAGVSVLTLPIVELGTKDLEPGQAGLGSGLVQTVRQISGAVGLAALTTVSNVAIRDTHTPSLSGTLTGYSSALLVLAVVAAIGAALAYALVPAKSH